MPRLPPRPGLFIRRAGVSFGVSRPYSWEEVSRVRGALSFIITVVVMAVVVWLIAAVVWLILRLII
jgi:hypothetical protein